MRAIFATIFLSMFLLNVAWGKDDYTEVESENMTATNKKDMEEIILQVCPRQQSQCYDKASDVKQRVKNRFSGRWSVIVFYQNSGYSSNVSYSKYLSVK